MTASPVREFLPNNTSKSWGGSPDTQQLVSQRPEFSRHRITPINLIAMSFSCPIARAFTHPPGAQLSEVFTDFLFHLLCLTGLPDASTAKAEAAPQNVHRLEQYP